MSQNAIDQGIPDTLLAQMGLIKNWDPGLINHNPLQAMDCVRDYLQQWLLAQTFTRTASDEEIQIILDFLKFLAEIRSKAVIVDSLVAARQAGVRISVLDARNIDEFKRIFAPAIEEIRAIFRTIFKRTTGSDTSL